MQEGFKAGVDYNYYHSLCVVFIGNYLFYIIYLSRLLQLYEWGREDEYIYAMAIFAGPQGVVKCIMLMVTRRGYERPERRRRRRR